MPMRNRGTVIEDWAHLDPHNLYGVKPSAMIAGPEAATHGGGVDRTADNGLLDINGEKWWHPDNPMFWFGMLAAATFGLVFVSTTVRLGPFKAGIEAGKE